jgi:hypothetical protein
VVPVAKKKKNKDMDILWLLSDLPLYNLPLIKLGMHQKFQHNSFMLFLLSDKLGYCLEYHLHILLRHVILVYVSMCLCARERMKDRGINILIATHLCCGYDFRNNYKLTGVHATTTKVYWNIAF